METLKEAVLRSINEGGASGHMMHITDYEDFTLDDLKGLIYNLFNGKVEDITEKIDGVNLQASVNDSGDVIFIRNSRDLNSENGGMSIDDMRTKWREKPQVMHTFVTSAEKIREVLERMPVKFFNPDSSTRQFVNCECVIEGTTNIIPYGTSNVMFHDIWVYKREDGKWTHAETIKRGLKDIEAAAEDVDGALITPKVIIDTVRVSEKLVKRHMSNFNRIFKSENLKDKNTIREYKIERFKRWLSKEAKWALSAPGEIENLYYRVIHNNTSITLRTLREIYKDNREELDKLCKEDRARACQYTNEDLDSALISMGNDLLDACTGFVNDNYKDAVTAELRKALEDTVALASEDDRMRDRLLRQMKRMQADDRINSTEGIVFTYRGKTMKVTGSFAPLNQILGSIRFSVI